ncbi:hypothetical protein ACM43_27440 [Bradyrhizobium sp. CCBAU 45321]|nr:hypothetical protein [Bradyrhizobium sp. CCBAU 45321]
MHQAIPAENDVGVRQRIARDVGNEKPTGQTVGCDTPAVCLDQRRYDVDAGVIDIELEPADPTGIAAGRIEQRARAEPLQQCRQRLLDRGCGDILRAEAGHRSGRAPEVGPLDPREPRGEIEA